MNIQYMNAILFLKNTKPYTILYDAGPVQPTNPFLPHGNQQTSSFGYGPEEYSGISMNPTQGGGSVNYSSSSSGYTHYNSQY